MKLKDFLTLKVGSGILLGSSMYNPYINYTWSNTFQVANKMYSKNTGNSGQNLQLFSGQGVKFNGTNQSIVVPVNATIMTEIKRINGAVVLNTNTQVITNYVIGTGSAAVHTDYFLFTDVLTQQEIELYTNNPNKFFQDTRDGVIDNCVLNMPLHGVDKYQVDYSKYFLGTSKYSISGTYSSDTSDTRIGQVTRGLLFEPNKTYSINYTLTDNINIRNFTLYIPPTSNAGVAIEINVVRTSAKQDFIVKIPSTYVKNDGNQSLYFWLVVNGTPTTTDFQNISIKEISGINEVLNYTAGCVTGAKQLPYGSQEANFFHTSSGVPIRTGLSPFFESTPYWNNYGNTGWIPKVTDSFIFEFIFNITNDAEFRLCGNDYASGVFFGKSSGGRKVYTKVFGSDISTLTVTQDIVLITCRYNPVTKGVNTYVNGVLVYTSTATSTTYRALPVLLGLAYSNGEYKVNTPIRHFKVITDAKTISTYNALTEYSKLVAKGLLANFVLDENGEYIQDEFGNYIMDI